MFVYVNHNSTNVLARDLANRAAMIIFKANWCGPCKEYLADLRGSKGLAALGTNNPDFKVYIVDTDDNPEITRDYGVTSLPVTFALQRGRIAQAHEVSVNEHISPSLSDRITGGVKSVDKQLVPFLEEAFSLAERTTQPTQ
jgi:thioredoxin 1